MADLHRWFSMIREMEITHSFSVRETGMFLSRRVRQAEERAERMGGASVGL